MIYLDSSVALAQLLVEERRPPAELWASPLVASRLIELELWTRIHARRLTRSHGDALRALLARAALIEMSEPVLARVAEPFPVAVRTLDAIHLASLLFLRERGQSVELASYDERLLAGARALGIPIRPL